MFYGQYIGFGSGSSGATAGGYSVENSVRLNDNDSAYMSWTPGGASDSDRVFTVSFWFKPGNISDNGDFIFQEHTTAGRDCLRISRLAGDALYIQCETAAGNIVQRTTTQVFRDPTSWYHICVQIDGSDASSGSCVLEVNGATVSDFSAETNPSATTDLAFFNTTRAVHIGAFARSYSGNYLDGYLSQFVVIDGTNLDATSFGEFDDEGEWRPIDVSGLTFGANGFLQDYAVAPGTGMGAGTDTSQAAVPAAPSVTLIPVNFDGSNDYLTRDADPTSIADGKLMTGSVWVRRTADGAKSSIFSSDDNEYVFADISSSNEFRVLAYNSSAVLKLNIKATTPILQSDGWVHFCWSVDLGNTTAHMYRNGVEDLTSITLVDDDMDYTRGAYAIGGLDNGTSKHTGDMAQFYLNTTEYVDLSSASNLVKFITTGGEPVDMGADGSTPTGTSPIIFLNGVVSTWHTNDGTGGGFTENGALTGGTSPVVVHAGNHFTDSGLAAADKVSDSPTNNFCVMSSIAKTTGVTLSDGNLNLVYNVDESGAVGTVMFDIEDTDGYYYECEFDVVGNSGSIGLANGDANPPAVTPGDDDGTWTFDKDGGIQNGSGSYQSNGSWDSGTNGAIGAGNYGVVAAKAGAVWYGTVPSGGGTITWYNGATQGEIEAGTTTNAAVTGLTGLFTAVAVRGSTTTTTQIYNFGQQDYQATDIPSGLKNISTANMTALTFDPTDHVQNEVYTGSGATGKSVTQSGNGSFTTQMAWIKSESQGSSGYNGYNVLVADLIAMGEDVYNPLNGQNNLDSDVNSVESFDSGGITLGSLDMINNSSDTFHVLMFGGASAEATNETGTIDSSVRVNTTADFSFGTWTGSGAAATIGHGLSGPPDVILVSNLTNDSKARMYHSHAGNTKALSMEEESDGWQTSTTYWNDTTPGGTTTGTFDVGSSSDTNGSGDTMFFFALKYVEGFSAGGGGTNPDSTDGPVYCTGGVPQYFQWSSVSAQTQVLTSYDASEKYNDGTRATTIFNAGDNAGFTHDVDFNSNGVKIRHTGSTADDHMWWAINRMPTLNKSGTPSKAR